jgi:hypothetical protein
VDSGSLAQAVLVAGDDPSFAPVAWPTADRVLLHDHSGRVWWLNPNTGELRPGE